MKRRIIALVCACFMTLAMALMAGCSQSSASGNASASASASASAPEKGITVVATIFPEYDWAKNVVGSEQDVNLVFLQNTGADLHSYQPTVQDLATVSDCDVFIYVGGESDEWVEDALENATNENMKVVNLMEVMGSKAKIEEVVEGMEAEEEEEGEEGEEEEGPEYDEHVWLSVRNAQDCVNAICEALCEADSAKADAFKANAKAYVDQLSALDAKYASTLADCSKSTLVFGDRFPFRYLTDDYNLTYYAAFVGCSAESEASFETITFLANKVDELGLSSVVALEGAKHDIADAVVANVKTVSAQIVSVDSMQSVTQKNVEEGTTYLGIMEANLDALKQALS